MSIASSSADVTPRQNNIPAEQNNTLSSSLPQLNNTVSGSNTNSQIGVFLLVSENIFLIQAFHFHHYSLIQL